MLTPATVYQKKMLWLIGVSVIIKIVLSHFLELGNDEVYYYTYAIQPDWNHFDHPGMVGWMMRLTSLNLNWVSTLSMRIGSIICAAGSSFVLFKIGTLLKNEKAGYIAAWMYSLSIYTSIIAGLFVLPDSPQLLFFTLSIYWMVKWVLQPAQFKTNDWIILGLLIGLATLSKVHGLYLWIGFGGYILFHQTKTLQNKHLYLAILVSIVCIIPILYWNIQNDFITYRYHSKRVMHTGIQFDSFLQQIIGEIIYQNPLVYCAVFISLFNFKKLKLAFQNEGLKLLLWLSLPLIFTFWTLSLFNPTLPHWTGPGFIGLFLIAGVYWSHWNWNSWSRWSQDAETTNLPSILKWAGGLLGVLILGFLLLVYTFPRQLGSTKLENLGEYNPINDVTGWKDFTLAFNKIVIKDKQDGSMHTNVIVVNKWFPAGHILFYTARPLHMSVIAIGALEDVHKFAWMNETLEQQKNGLKIGDDAYCIVPSNLPSNPSLLYGKYFEDIQKPDTIPVHSKGILLRNFYVYRLKNCKALPSSILPPTK